jgi:hypothetical protein
MKSVYLSIDVWIGLQLRSISSKLLKAYLLASLSRNIVQLSLCLIGFIRRISMRMLTAKPCSAMRKPHRVQGHRLCAHQKIREEASPEIIAKGNFLT